MKKKKPVVKKKTVDLTSDFGIIKLPEKPPVVPEPVLPLKVSTPDPKFILLRSERLDDNLVEDMYAMDLPSNGCLVRTIWTGNDGQFINATMFHVPNMGIRNGRLMRSLV